MLMTTNIDQRPVYRLITWCTLFAFFINILSYSLFIPGLTIPKPEQEYSVGSLVDSLLNLFASSAEAAEADSVKGTVTPSQVASAEKSSEPVVTIDNKIKNVKVPESLSLESTLSTMSAGVGGLDLGTGGAADVNVYTGAFSYSYPIQVPPGRGGLAPQLALSYLNSRQNGWIGMGWDITIGSIERSTKFGKPDYTDNDTFIMKLQGSGFTLVNVGGNEYRLKDEGAFLKVIKSGDTWTAKDKNGTLYTFGSSSGTRLDGGSGTFRWYLAGMTDANGNGVTFSYYKDSANNYLYPSQIDYNVDNHVVFTREARTDSYDMYNTFFRVKTAERLKSIKVYHGSESNEANLVRKYVLAYSYSDSTGRSTLDNITPYGANGSPLPATSFGWLAGGDGFTNDLFSGMNLNTNNPISDYNWPGDFNGDGKMDIASWVSGMGGSQIRVHYATGNGFTSNTYSGLTLNTNSPIRDYNWLGDFNGDGKTDIASWVSGSGSSQIRIHYSTGSGFTNDLYSGLTLNTNNPIRDYNWLGDFNGDGKTDIASWVSGSGTTHIRIHYSTGAGFTNDLYSGLTLNSNNPIRDYNWLGDFNGDGKTDIASWVSGSGTTHIRIHYSTGSGFTNDLYSGLTLNSNNPIRDHNWLGDFNGDGKTDIASWVSGSGSSQIRIHYSTGAGFTNDLYSGLTLNSNNPIGDYNWLGDFNSDGKLDIASWVSGSGGSQIRVHYSTGNGFTSNTYSGLNLNIGDPLTDHNWLGDFNGDAKLDIASWVSGSGSSQIRIHSGIPPIPDLIDSVTSPLGATTTVEYTPSSNWQNQYLPFKVQTVSSITVNDNMGHTASRTYIYEGGLYEPIPREFRGFEKVVVTDHVTGLVTETHYHQDQVFQGRINWTETKDSGGVRVIRTDNTWAASDFGGGRFFAYIDQSVVAKYKADNSLLATITTDFGYDSYGNLLYEDKQTSDGIRRFTRTEYLNDTTNWVLGKPTRVRIAGSDPDSGGQVLRETRMTYYPAQPWRLETKKLIHWKDSIEYEYTTTYGYDGYGNVTSVTDPRNHTTQTNYSESSGMFPNLTTNALGQTIHRTFDARFGTVTAETDPNGQTVSYSYDQFGRKDYVSYPDGSYKDFSYNIQAGNHYVTVQASGVPTATVYYDNLGRKIKEKLQADTTTIEKITEYDNAGRVVSKSLPYFPGQNKYYSTFEYHPVRGYLKKQTNPDGTYKTISQDGFSETITDERGKVKTITKDSLGRLKRVTEPTGGITDYSYDLFDNLTYVKGPTGNETFIYYDDLGQKTSMDDPYMGHWEYDYDQVGNLTWQKDQKNQEVTIQYDALNRMTQKNYQSDGRTITYTYDEARTSYYNKGSLTTVAESGGTTTEYNYDRMGRQVNETRTLDSIPYEIARAYDQAGRLDTIIYPDNSEFDYMYAPMGYLSQIDKVEPGGARYTVADFSDHNALGQMGYMSYGNGAGTDYNYHPSNFRLERMTTTDISAAVIQDLSYTFDNVGNVETITDHHNSVSHAFVYDEVNRLTSATATAQSDPFREYQQGYTYDLAGNMTAKAGIGGWQIMEYDSARRPISIIFNDEIAGIGERTIIYNQDNKPMEISYDSGTTSYLTYDGEGNRVKKVQGADTAIYVGGLYEVRNGEAVLHVFANGKRIASFKGTKKYFTHSDHLGSTSVVTDENGLIVEEIGYLPFGATLFRNAYQGSQWTSVYRFTGQEFDQEYHLYNYNARLYDPIMARFITADTIVPDWTNPQTLNRYSYVINNPLKYIDPSGNDFGLSLLIGALIGAVLGGTMAAVTGGNIGQGMLLGAISGAFLGGASAIAEAASLSKIAEGALYMAAGGTSGGINAAITGGDIGQAVLTSAGFTLASYICPLPKFEVFGDSAKSAAASVGNRVFNSSITGASVGAAYASATGDDIWDGAKKGAMAWAIGESANMLIGHGLGYAKSGKGPEFENGVFIYNVKGERPFAIGGAVIGDDDWLLSCNKASELNGYSVYEHELSHIEGRQRTLGPGYLPAHLLSQGISGMMGVLRDMSFKSFRYSTHEYNIFERWWIEVPAY